MPNILMQDAGSTRNPSLAPMLSLFPGLGQIYNGQARKGLLFIATAMSYLFVFVLMAFNRSLIDWLKTFGQSVHMSPNPSLVSALAEFHFGSSLSFIVTSLFIAFVICAMHDAYEHARFLQWKSIYADNALEITEATSGSYLLHFMAIIVFFILAAFFFRQSPVQHVTYIEFVPNQVPTKRVIYTPYKTDQRSDTGGVHKPKLVVPATNPRGSNANKVAQPAVHAGVHVPQFHPVLANNPVLLNKTLPVSPVSQKIAMNPVLPSLRQTDMSQPTLPTLVPQQNHNLISPPQPSVTDRGNAVAKIAPPQLTNSAGINNGTINNKVPQPISSNSGDKYIPMPTNLGGGKSSAQNSASNNFTNIGPTRMTNTVGDFGKPGTVVRPVVPGFGDPRAMTDERSNGNPMANTNTHGPISIPAAPVDFGPYMNDLQRRIKQNWFPPKNPESKRVEVIFKIHTGGELTDLRMYQSSGVDMVDQGALRAVQNAAPFRPLPKGASESIDIQFTFDYNVFGGSTGVFRRY